MNAVTRLVGTIAALGVLALGVITVPDRGPREVVVSIDPPPATAPPPGPREALVVPVRALPARLPGRAPSSGPDGPTRLERVLTAARQRLAAPGAAPADVEPALRALARELDADERARLAAGLADPARSLRDVLAATELVRVLGEGRPALSADALAHLRRAAASVEEPHWRDAAARSLAALGTARDHADLIETLRGPTAEAARAARALRHAPAQTLADLAWSLESGGEAPFENHLLVLIEAACRTDGPLEEGVRASTRAALERARGDASHDARTRARVEACLAALADEAPPATPVDPVQAAETTVRRKQAPEAERRRALYELGAHARPRSLEILASACATDPSPGVRAAGLRALRAYPPEQRRPLLADAAALDPSGSVRAQATQELRELDAR